MKIVVDKNIPYLAGRLEPVCDTVVYASATDTDTALVADADALVTRTRTHCDASLLDGSRVQLIASATIGTDHIDLDYCRRHGIAVANAPGCNAPAVAQWVLSTVALWSVKEAPGRRLSIGVVGVGHVGSIVARWAERVGMNVLLCDPPRQRREGGDQWCTLDDIAHECDIITVHTPLTRDGIDATYHMIGEEFMKKLPVDRPVLLMNAARGAVADTAALVGAPENVSLAIDCWENEPKIDRQLLKRAFVATPHIAGYSIEGKQRGTAMALAAVNRHFGLNAELPQVKAPAQGADIDSLVQVLESYDPMGDTHALKSRPAAFERLRNNYSLRHETK